MSDGLLQGLVFCAIAGLAVMIALALDRAGAARRQLASRLEGMARPQDVMAEGESDIRLALDRKESSLDQFFDLKVARISRLRQRLLQAGLDLSASEFVLGSLTLCLVIAFGLGIAGLPIWMAAGIGLVLGAGGPWRVLGIVQGRRARRFLAVFPEALDLIVRGLRAGIPVTEAIGSIGAEVAEPVASQFRAVADSIAIGTSMEDAFNESASRVGIEDYRFFIISLAIQRETGGNLSETLSNLSDVIRKRQELRLKVRAMSSEARASGMILGALPFVAGGALLGTNPEYILILAHDPFGHILIGVAAAMLLAGILTMARMVNFEV